MYTLPRHRKCQLIVTVAISLAVAAHYLILWLAPEWINAAPLVGAAASILWIWVE